MFTGPQLGLEACCGAFHGAIWIAIIGCAGTGRRAISIRQ
jgi:hypothetical protein